jgi:hypothetical protein
MLHSNKATKAFADYDATYDFQFIVSSKAPRLQQKKAMNNIFPLGGTIRSSLGWQTLPALVFYAHFELPIWGVILWWSEILPSKGL